ncbi:MAG TPA: rhamnulokinase family protein [Bryobacteraceae bacterium]|jgi:rhamnulokinase|nr:rhamnulokinase family protein [Bryobacteraceae bacterium]
MGAGGAHLAFDLGAESGRAFVGRLEAGNLELREIHRFSNEPVEYGRGLYWDAARLWLEIRSALHFVDGTDITSVGVDAWGVDYALLGERGELLQNPRHYRDRRNVAAMQELLKIVSAREVYRMTGIQFMPINTLNQLFAAKRETPRILAAAERLVMIPDLFHYWLSGNAACEYTTATTTQFVNPTTRSWASDLLNRLGLPSQLPAPLVEPGSIVGKLKRGLTRKESLRETLVVTPASHDTASAVAAISARDHTAFLSSGTWSLLGMEVDAPIISEEAFRLNFTNEGGVCRTTRLLKNVMGLWMLQGCRRSWAARGLELNYTELMDAARRAPAFHRLINPDDVSFLNPDDMIGAIDKFCAKWDQPAPDGPGSYARTILESLALKYRLLLGHLESLTGRRITDIRVVGGGARNRLLSQFTADATGRRVLSGPVEAAALGNIAVQMAATGAVSGIPEARAIIDRSFPPEIFEPEDTAKWDAAAQRFQQYCEFIYA